MGEPDNVFLQHLKYWSNIRRCAASGSNVGDVGYAKRHRTRAVILDAALAEASERGLHRASVAGIAARANTAVGNLHYHFGSRAELLRAMIRRLMTDFVARLAATDAQQPGDFFARHRAEPLAYVAYVRQNPAHIRLVDELKFVEPKLYRQGIHAWVQLLSERLREGIADGSVRAMDEMEIAAQAHFLVGARRFLEDLVDEVGAEDEVRRVPEAGATRPGGPVMEGYMTSKGAFTLDPGARREKYLPIRRSR
jgi:AcrR family transcriptional regulator